MTPSPSFKRLSTPHQVDEVMNPKNEAPSILYFWGPKSCGSCGCGSAKVECFEEISLAYQDEAVYFFKIDTQQNPELMRPFQIRSIPTFLFILKGEILDLYLGGIDPQQFVKKVDFLLSKSRGEGFFKRFFSKQPNRLAELNQSALK